MGVLARQGVSASGWKRDDFGGCIFVIDKLKSGGTQIRLDHIWSYIFRSKFQSPKIIQSSIERSAQNDSGDVVYEELRWREKYDGGDLPSSDTDPVHFPSWRNIDPGRQYVILRDESWFIRDSLKWSLSKKLIQRGLILARTWRHKTDRCDIYYHNRAFSIYIFYTRIWWWLNQATTNLE